MLTLVLFLYQFFAVPRFWTVIVFCNFTSVHHHSEFYMKSRFLLKHYSINNLGMKGISIRIPLFSEDQN